jgi:hypothetical protein
MHKHLTNLTAFEAKTSNPVGSWDSALKSWDEIVSQLTPQILYDIGEIDCRPRHAKSDVWDCNPYRLLIDAIIPRSPSESDPRR